MHTDSNWFTLCGLKPGYEA